MCRVFFLEVALQIEMMPAEARGGVVLPEWDAAWLAKQLAELDREQAKAALQPTVERLKLIGALEPEFEL